MRVLKDNHTSLPAADETLDKGEVQCTCTKCLSSFAFRQTDPEVVTTNEMEFQIDCPVCGAPLEMQKHTGIVRQRQPEG
jgi:Zn finger protein HypA/HybF involved in hydrogenase expression